MENTIEKIPLTCIICPMGCSMEVEVETDADGHKKVLSVKDNGCKRGEQYAAKELQKPTRTLTSTIKVNGGVLPVVPVKTAGEVPKNMLLQCMEVVRRANCKAPVKRGDILLYDLLGTGINVIACADVEKV
jgi:CxxC motif-containing protein